MRRLLIRPGAIGDCICALPALQLLQGDDTEVWTNGAVAPLIRNATRCRSLAGTGFSLLGLPHIDLPEYLERQLRSFDEILSWSGANQPLLLERMEALGVPFHAFSPLPDPQGDVHVSDFLIAQTSAWHGFSEEPKGWRKPFGRRFLLRHFDNDKDRVDPSTVVLHPFSGSLAKNWPIANFRRLAEQLQSVYPVRWCAGPEDPLPEDLRQDAWQFESLADLGARLAQAALFIGNDSGVTHLAASLGVPVVAVFGPMRPEVWAPRGSVVRVVQASVSGAPASAIPYEFVWDIVEDLLTNPARFSQ